MPKRCLRRAAGLLEPAHHFGDDAPTRRRRSGVAPATEQMPKTAIHCSR
jgi:hypothetical protein